MVETVSISKSLRQWTDLFMHQSMRGWNRFVKESGLTMAQFSVLMQLHYKKQVGISEVGERFGVSPAAASQLADKLVQADLIERAEDPADRRVKLIQLSQRGKKLVETGLAERYRWMDGITSSLDAQDKAKVAEALRILTEAAHSLIEAP
ncbi:MAG: MarR family transcriptional regulator [Anaerolineales bacterium]|nr:MarR family transcriptional regulator [Anaerolineales bacterium]